jgi:hypothetical protein
VCLLIGGNGGVDTSANAVRTGGPCTGVRICRRIRRGHLSRFHPPGGLATAAAAEIILSDKSALALAAEHGVSAQAIWNIRRGKSYADVYARLKEQGYSVAGFGEKLCQDCRYWQEDGCDFRFPDAGADFATDCYLYARAKETRLLQ